MRDVKKYVSPDTRHRYGSTGRTVCGLQSAGARAQSLARYRSEDREQLLERVESTARESDSEGEDWSEEEQELT